MTDSVVNDAQTAHLGIDEKRGMLNARLNQFSTILFENLVNLEELTDAPVPTDDEAHAARLEEERTQTVKHMTITIEQTRHRISVVEKMREALDTPAAAPKAKGRA